MMEHSGSRTTSSLAAPRAVLERYTAFIGDTFGSEGTATRNLILFIAGYFLLEAFSSTLGKTGGGTDTSEMILYSQYWDWGYGNSQPPLPAWLSKAVADVFGLSLFSLALAKFAMLAAMFVAVVVAARRLGLSPIAGAAACFGIFAIPEFGWEAQRSLIPTPGMMAFCAIGLVALVEARKNGSLWAYLLFGVAAAGATLCKYNGILFFVAIVMAAVVLPPWRATVLNRKIAVSLLTFAVLFAPHALWAIGHPYAVTERAYKFGIGMSDNVLGDRMAGLVSFLKVSFNLLLMPVLIAGATLLAYPDLRRSLALPRRADPDSLPAAVVAASLMVALAAVLVSGAISVHNHWLQPAVFLAPMAIAVAASRAGLQVRTQGAGRDPINLALASVGFAFAVVAAVALPLHTMTRGTGEPHPFKLDYARFLAELDADAGAPVGSVVATNYRIFANLRLARPQLQVIDPALPDPEDQLTGPAVIIWEDGRGQEAGLDAFLTDIGIASDELERHATRLVRADQPDIGREIEYSIVPGAE